MRERACAPVALPASVTALVAGRDWSRDLVGESGCAVYRLAGESAPDLFLKHGSGAFSGDVADEAARLVWLAGWMTVPRFVHHERTAGDAWLLTEAMPGRTAYQVLEDGGDRLATVRAIARALRRLHAIPLAACPFNSDADRRLVHARARIDAGLVEEEEFDAERQGWTAEQVWTAMTALLPLAPDPVVTHGDYSLDNLLMVDGEVTGLIDLARVGVADRYQDLAIMWNCLGEFEPELPGAFLEAYGAGEADERKLSFHLMLDECF